MPERQDDDLTKMRAGHVRSTRCRRAGFTVLELLIIVAVMATIAAIAIPSLKLAIGVAKNARAAADVRTIGNESLAYLVQYGYAPNTLADIGYDQNTDAWGQHYQYLNISTMEGNGVKEVRTDRFSVPINTYFDLYSLGPDGLTATQITATQSQDDIIWANDGVFIGIATNY